MFAEGSSVHLYRVFFYSGFFALAVTDLVDDAYPSASTEPAGTDPDVLTVADVLGARGWVVERALATESRAGEEWPPRECSVPTSCARLRPNPHPPQPPRILCGVDGRVCGVGRGCAASTPRLVLLRMPPFALPPCLINLFPRCVFLLVFSATLSSPLSACSFLGFCLIILLILCHVHACPFPLKFPFIPIAEIDLLALLFAFFCHCSRYSSRINIISTPTDPSLLLTLNLFFLYRSLYMEDRL